ncbi:MAG: DUF1616 domain-containing protein [Candidatus Methanomethylicia archaeon]
MSWVFDDEVLAVVLAVVVVGFVFGFSQFILSGRVVEPFSALGLLGPNMRIGDYPREVVVGVPFKLYLYVHNFEGRSVYYRILVKLGDRNSTISSVKPLDSNPIMEFRRVLTHNQTWIYPVNITLYDSGVNRRLVFEMWIYNETSKGFSYYGRWNQLWINVTASPLNLTSTGKSIVLPSEVEDLLIKGFLAVRRAEDSGGDVNVMVSILNEALDYAQMEGYVEAGNLVEKVLSMEGEVSRIGLENRNRQLLFNVVLFGAVLSGSIGSYAYLRRRIWIFWSRVKSNCIVKCSVRLNEVEDKNCRRILEFIRSVKEVTVEELVSNSGRFKLRDYEVAKALFNMVRDDVIFLEDPNPPLKFHAYMLSFYNLDFWVTVTLLVLTIISIQFSQAPMVLFRYVFGSLFVLFLPGYSLIEALYPKEKDLTPLERLALSIGLSLALVPLVGLVLNYTPWGIRLTPIIISLTLLTLILMFLSSWRKYSYLKLSFTARGFE